MLLPCLADSPDSVSYAILGKAENCSNACSHTSPLMAHGVPGLHTAEQDVASSCSPGRANDFVDSHESSSKAPCSLENGNLADSNTNVPAPLSGNKQKPAKASWPPQEANSEAMAPCFARMSSLQLFSLLKRHVSHQAPCLSGALETRTEASGLPGRCAIAHWRTVMCSCTQGVKEAKPSVAQRTRLMTYTLKPTSTCIKGSL